MLIRGNKKALKLSVKTGDLQFGDCSATLLHWDVSDQRLRETNISGHYALVEEVGCASHSCQLKPIELPRRTQKVEKRVTWLLYLSVIKMSNLGGIHVGGIFLV